MLKKEVIKLIYDNLDEMELVPYLDEMELCREFVATLNKLKTEKLEVWWDYVGFEVHLLQPVKFNFWSPRVKWALRRKYNELLVEREAASNRRKLKKIQQLTNQEAPKAKELESAPPKLKRSWISYII